MIAGMKGRVTVLLVAAALIGGAVVARVWLAATGSYGDTGLPVMLRVGSAIGLAVGFLLAGAAVAWPMRKAEARAKPGDNASS